MKCLEDKTVFVFSLWDFELEEELLLVVPTCAKTTRTRDLVDP
jgi:hypothetical protein